MKSNIIVSPFSVLVPLGHDRYKLMNNTAATGTVKTTQMKKTKLTVETNEAIYTKRSRKDEKCVGR